MSHKDFNKSLHNFSLAHVHNDYTNILHVPTQIPPPFSAFIFEISITPNSRFNWNFIAIVNCKSTAVCRRFSFILELRQYIMPVKKYVH
jgi:hypothetical protein